MSDLKTFDLNTVLSADELLVLLAIVDIRRADVLLSYLGRETQKEISFAQIRQQLYKPERGSLTRILTGNYNYSIPKIEDTKVILDQLTTKKLRSLMKDTLFSARMRNSQKNSSYPRQL